MPWIVSGNRLREEVLGEDLESCLVRKDLQKMPTRHIARRGGEVIT